MYSCTIETVLASANGKRSLDTFHNETAQQRAVNNAIVLGSKFCNSLFSLQSVICPAETSHCRDCTMN